MPGMPLAASAGGLLFGQKYRAFRSVLPPIAALGAGLHRQQVGRFSLRIMVDIAGKDGIPYQGRQLFRRYQIRGQQSCHSSSAFYFAEPAAPAAFTCLASTLISIFTSLATTNSPGASDLLHATP